MSLFILTLSALFLFPVFALTQDQSVGGPCQDCEALFDYHLYSIKPTANDTLPHFAQNHPKIRITGTVFKRDGKTPADDVILYIYHVDRNGVYQPSDNPVGWEKRHGQYRGWLKTDTNGKYTFYTFRPVSYPIVQEPEHIHIYVKEPNKTPYYIDNFMFESDPTLTEKIKRNEKKRGGSGIVRLEEKNGIWMANRNITLGMNIPNYK